MSLLPDGDRPSVEMPPIAQPMSKAEKRRTLLHWLIATAAISCLILLGSILAD